MISAGIGVPLVLELVSAGADVTATCLYVLGGDRSGSQDSPALVKEHIEDAYAVLEEAARCDANVVVQSIKWPLAQSTVWSGSLQGRGDSDFARDVDAERRLEEAKRAVEEVFSSPAKGPSNHLGFLLGVEDHVAQFAGTREVHVWAFGDGINTVEPLEMRRSDLSDAGIEATLAELDLPECRTRTWVFNFVGTNRTKHGSRDDEFSNRVRAFWDAFANGCGGTVDAYGSDLVGTS